MHKHIKWTLIPLMLIAVGCSKAPVEDFSMADQSIEGARMSKAEQFASEEWRMAMDTLEAAKTEKAKQDDRFTMFRSYGHSKELAQSAARLAAEAKTAAEQEIAYRRQQAEEQIASARGQIEQVSALLATAPVGKGNRADIELMKQDLEAMKLVLDETAGDLQRLDFDAAASKTQTVLDKCAQMTTELQAAIQKKSRA
ncbi:MAG TPA: hypothetical protein VGB22_01355 [candidate division Zixibacteria bacterium]|jgi:hypothetical protein